MVLYSLFMFLCLVICNSEKSEIFKSVIVKIKKEVWINVTTACRTGVKASLGKNYCRPITNEI